MNGSGKVWKSMNGEENNTKLTEILSEFFVLKSNLFFFWGGDGTSIDTSGTKNCIFLYFHAMKRYLERHYVIHWKILVKLLWIESPKAFAALFLFYNVECVVFFLHDTAKVNGELFTNVKKMSFSAFSDVKY